VLTKSGLGPYTPPNSVIRNEMGSLLTIPDYPQGMNKRRKPQGKWRKIKKTPIFSLRLAP